MYLFSKKSLLLFLGLFSSFLWSDDRTLTTIKKEIEVQQKQISQQTTQYKKLMSDLKEQENKISQNIKKLAQLSEQLTQTRKEITSLEKEISELTQKKNQQSQLLSQQLVEVFKTGQTKTVDLIFNPQHSKENERLISYYSYLNQARQKSIIALNQTTLQLNASLEQLNRVKQKQQQMLDEQKESQKILIAEQKKREKTADELQRSVKQSNSRIDQLKREETALLQQITLAEQKEKQRQKKEKTSALGGLGAPKNQYMRPTNGSLKHFFGEKINDQLFWTGLVILAKEGTPVKAIHDGRVILASWLEGYGFMVVLDHGQGDMSIYGYNQHLKVEVGDLVLAGDEIASVGKTGGQSNAGLYFEIRRNGKAQNPQAWLRR